MLRTVSAVILALVLATPALAFQCPSDIKKIDAALAANPNLDSTIGGIVKTMRDTGDRLHNSGKHADAVRTLAGALDLLEKLGVKVN